MVVPVRNSGSWWWRGLLHHRSNGGSGASSSSSTEVLLCGVRRRLVQRPSSSSVALLAVTLLGLFNVLLSVRYRDHVAAAQTHLVSPSQPHEDMNSGKDFSTSSTDPDPAAPAAEVVPAAASPDDRDDGNKVRYHNLQTTKRTLHKYGGRALGRLRQEDFPPPPPSPYEMANPGKKLPKWSTKPFFFTSRRGARGTEALSRICYVHVGKTAGSTIGCALGFQLHCHQTMVYPPGILPGSCTNMFHSNINDCLNEDFAHYLITVRDPVERIKSWYSYEALDRLKKDCSFRTLNDLALQGLTQDDPNTSQECRDRAYRALTGKEQIGWHAYNNYEFYIKELPLNASLGVIRSEHMLDDWNSMEAWLGSDARARPFPAKNTASKEKELNKVLSPRAQELICAALCREIGFYKRILHDAVNLTPSQVQQSLMELRGSCPKEADEESCPSMDR